MIRVICWFFVFSLLTILVFAGISYQTAVTSTIVEGRSIVFEIKDGQTSSCGAIEAGKYSCGRALV